MMVGQAIFSRLGWNEYRSFRAYERFLTSCLRANPKNRPLAFAQAIGAETLDTYREQGDGHVAVLRHHGLRDGMAVFDLGCGCGRTAEALMRSGWQGSFTGVDVIERFVAELRARCPGYDAFRHRKASIPAPDSSLDMLYHWSVFTHLSLEECYLYLQDTFRALKPGGKTVFSFLELNDPAHRPAYFKRIDIVARGRKPDLLDTFLHRDWIRFWAGEIGFEQPEFTDGTDVTHHPAFWQSLVALTKPVA
jgi:SAM-dependent methyltransferase